MKNKEGIIKSLKEGLWKTRLNSNLNYNYNYGSILGLCLIIQIVTGIILSGYYVGDFEKSYSSVERIMREVIGGWEIRYVHSVNATLFFLITYSHIFRSLYYNTNSGSRVLVFRYGIIILILLIGSAFLGYILPSGNMSYWAGSVITNLITAIPYVGEYLLKNVIGGFGICNSTIGRFFAIHYILPLITAGIIVLHILELHRKGGSNILGVRGMIGEITFDPYYSRKDLFGYICYMILLGYIIKYIPEGYPFGDIDNNNEANIVITPSKIVPHIYLLWTYGILRSVNSKLGGIILMGGALGIWFVESLFEYGLRRNRLTDKKLKWVLVSIVLILTWLGTRLIEYPINIIGKYTIIGYFSWFIIKSILGIYDNLSYWNL